MSKEEFRLWAIKQGWTEDRFGHFHKGDMRFKVQAYSVRLERSYMSHGDEYTKSEKRYVRLRSGYLKSLSVSADGKLSGLQAS